MRRDAMKKIERLIADTTKGSAVTPFVNEYIDLARRAHRAGLTMTELTLLAEEKLETRDYL